jgi:hypothetical protein
LEREADDEEGVRRRDRKTRRSNHGAFWQGGGSPRGSSQEKDGTGKPVGLITVTYQGPIADGGTCATNPLCNGTWHEGYLYALEGGTITVGSATAYQGQAPFKDENGFAPIVGFSVGAITGGTGKYQDISGTLTMRWDANVCICLFDIVEP